MNARQDVQGTAQGNGWEIVSVQDTDRIRRGDVTIVVQYTRTGAVKAVQGPGLDDVTSGKREAIVSVLGAPREPREDVRPPFPAGSVRREAHQLREGDRVEVGRRPGVAPGSAVVVQVDPVEDGTYTVELDNGSVFVSSRDSRWRVLARGDVLVAYGPGKGRSWHAGPARRRKPSTSLYGRKRRHRSRA